MYILGAGCAFPETVINNPFLAELSREEPASLITELSGVRSRNSVLDPTYLRDTGNVDSSKAYASSSASPTDLAIIAAEAAMSRAGVVASDLGLIIGDTSTPTETIPSEAQRIAKRLGAKVVAYDILSPGAALCLALSNFLSWKEDRIPELILWVSTNTPTQKICYRTGAERQFLGDGASAMVLSTKRAGKLKVLNAAVSGDSSSSERILLDLYDPAKFGEDSRRELNLAEAKIAAIGLQSAREIGGDLSWIGSQFDPNFAKSFAEANKISAEHAWGNGDRVGYSLSAASGTVLAERWDRLTPASNILITQVGDGGIAGFALLRVEA